MSKSSWRKEFYPIPPSKVPKKNALKHSLQKWIGMLPENLEKHGLEKDDVPIRMDSKTCTLCYYYGKFTCIGCPFNENESEFNEEFCREYFESWWRNNNPKPMIEALQRLVEKCK
jgi:hypothetical protein